MIQMMMILMKRLGYFVKAQEDRFGFPRRCVGGDGRTDRGNGIRGRRR